MQESVVNLTSHIRKALEVAGFKKTTARYADNSVTYYTDTKTGERFAVAVALEKDMPSSTIHKRKY